MQSCISEVAAKVRVLAQYIFEAIRSSWYASPKFFKIFPPLAILAGGVSLILKKFFTFYADTQEGYIKRLELAAERGDSLARYDLGCIYRDGTNGVEKSDEESLKWFKLAADHGHSEVQYKAQYNLSRMYLSGWRKRHIQLAAEKENQLAQYKLGWIYLNGTNGVEKNVEKGLEWLKRAAEHGYSEAQNDLGSIYRDGTNGVKKDVEESLKWFRIAERQGNREMLEKF